jgi:hypothetical protein
MKAVSKFILFVAACLTVAWFSLSIQAQDIDPPTSLPAASTKSAGVNPATGLPAAPSGPAHLDPKTGLPMGLTLDDIGQHTYPAGAVPQSLTILPEVEELIEKSKYDDALQLLLDNHQQFKLNDPLAETLLPDWIELSRRFPKAKAALIEIRDQYQNEFDAGRGYQLLFGELSAINSQLQQDDSTYALFQSIRKKDRKLAEQCFGTIAPLLIKRGEFDLCLSYVGDPKENFDSIRGSYDWTLAHQHHADLLKRQSDQQLAQINQQLGLTNHVKPLFDPNYYPPPPVPVNPVPSPRDFTEDSFVNRTRQLIEILVGAGRKAEAEEIQGKAVAVLDDPRLKSAVSDATQQVQKLSPHNP